MLVCHCAVVNDARIREAIDAGATDVLSVANACGAGSFCGGCQPRIASLMSELTGKPPSSFLVPTTTAGIYPAQNQTLTVVRGIEEDIVGKGWPLGERLGFQDEIITRYATSRGIARQALLVLERHGIVQRGQHHNEWVVGAPNDAAVSEAAVVYLEAADVGGLDIVDARRVLEQVALREAWRRSGSGLAERLHLAPPGEARHVGERALVLPDLHRAIVAESGIPVLGLLIDILLTHSRSHVPLVSSGLRAEVDRAHRAIADAVAAGMGEQAEALLLAHLDSLGAWMGDRAAGAGVARDSDQPASAQPDDPWFVIRSVLADIRLRGLAPGDTLGSDRELGERYGMGRTAFREALPLLEHYSLLARQPGPEGSVVVAIPDPWPSAQLIALYFDYQGVTVEDVFEVRQALEQRAVALACDRIDNEGRERLRQRLAEENAVRVEGGGSSSLYHNIHPLIAELSGNPAVALFANALTLMLLRHVRRHVGALYPSETADEIAQVHGALVDAIVAGDAPLALELAETHLARHSFLTPTA